MSYPYVEIELEVDGQKVKVRTHLMVEEEKVFKEPENFDEAFEKAGAYLDRLNELFELLGELGKESLKNLGREEAKEAAVLIHLLGYSGQKIDTEPLYSTVGAYMYPLLQKSKPAVDKYLSFLLGEKDVTFTVEELKPKLSSSFLSTLLSQATGICLDGCGRKRKFVPHAEDTPSEKIKEIEGRHEEKFKKVVKTQGFKEYREERRVNLKNFPQFEDKVVDEVIEELKEKSEVVRKYPEPLSRAIVRNALRAMANEIAGRKIIEYGPWTSRVENLTSLSGYFRKEKLEEIESKGLGKIMEKEKIAEDIFYARILTAKSKIKELEEYVAKEFKVPGAHITIQYEEVVGNLEKAYIKIAGEKGLLERVKSYVFDYPAHRKLTKSFKEGEGVLEIVISGSPEVVYKLAEEIREKLCR